MGYEKMTDMSTDTVTALGGMNSKSNKSNPTQIEGYYLGSRNVATANGPSAIHVFQTAKGNEGVWGTSKLNNNLTKAVIGKKVKVVYKGKIKITGGKTQHTYEFFVDKTDVIEVDVLPEGQETLEAEEYSTDDSTDTPEEDEETAAAELLAAAECKAKVQAMLNKNKTK